MEMDERAMIDLHAAPSVLLVPLCLAAGFLLGLAYFRALRTTAEMLVTGDRPLLALVLTLARFVCLGAGFYAAVLAGGPALLAALAGVLGARRVVLRGLREVRT